MIIDKISVSTGIDKKKILSIAETADERYKVYEIPKRTGGTRLIEHPSQELKALQRWISKVLIDKMPVHDCATAYSVGSGIKQNAYKHVNSLYTNRYDFSGFFPSFKRPLVARFLDEELPKIGISTTSQDIDFVCDIICRNDRITIGAPSSPALTNAMMFRFDLELNNYSLGKNLIYTRYADDIFISSFEANQLSDLENVIQAIKKDIPYLKLRLNRAKTKYMSKKHLRRITGVVITPDNRLSIGRDRKREIKALIHKWKNGQLAPFYVGYMRGLIAFAIDVEPTFLNSLKEKYGKASVEEILRSPNLGEKPDPDFIFF